MPNRIRILPEDVANKIAAGEVIERPASVVKELIENAIDAGGTRIGIEIKAGGKQLIRVTDNGAGMTRDDAILAFDRHATSKITSADDLARIGTLGFRGEALPSIASVSKVELITNVRESVAGTVIRIDGGVIKSVDDVGRAEGTTLSVSQLFFNVPARRKFLRGADTEQRHIANVVTNTAMAYPEMAFSLTSDGREIVALPAVNHTHARARAVCGDTLMNQMLPVTFEDETFRIDGFIGRPDAARIARTNQYVFINRRAITSRLLNHAVYEGYGSLLPKDRYPVTILFLTLDLDQVDVNVHPTKREVRFSNESFVYERTMRAVRLALQSADIIPDIRANSRTMVTIPPIELAASKAGIHPLSRKQLQTDLFVALNRAPQAAPAWTFTPPAEPAPAPSPSPDPPVPSAPPGEPEAHADEGLIPLWQLHNTYIFAQIKGGLVIIDQHVAHERILFERALAAIRESAGTSQQLMFPITVDLTMPQFAIVKDYLDLFNKIGFSLKLFGGQTVVIEAVPSLIRQGGEERLLQNMIDVLADRPETGFKPEERIAAAFACEAAITKGRPLVQQEMNALINDLFATSMPYACPHGRPIVVRIPLEELDRKFKRT
ncbi:MAG: DNA mismatch repair endonuclease MutL [Candidatus Latescibacteria bacterium]|nr:DNA mismatch repair endonuclease MutL [Candidatus Latescibacterota bacterium]